MSRTSSPTEPKLPVRITSSVKSAKKRSTRFSQDDEVGVKWDLKRGWRSSHALTDLRVLVRGVIVLDQMHIKVLGCLTVDLLQEAQPFNTSMALLSARDQLAFARIERGEQRHSAMARVVVRHRARPSWRQRQPELSALQGLTPE
jgi:hypothetical protein